MYLDVLKNYVNLVDIDENMPTVPQIGVTICFNIHFLREYIEISIYSLRNE